jgi:predicted DCC family thiol-disulfide oxidoreductase YuxK
MLPSHIILFDGVCTLCESSVRFIIKHDKAGRFKFTQAQSVIGQQMQSDLDMDALASGTLILIKNGKAFCKSDAALEIVRDLTGPWKALVCLKIIPACLRNAVYDVIARRRYRWFGKRDTCMIPDEAFKQRFL